MKHYWILLLIFLVLTLASCQVAQISARKNQPELEVQAQPPKQSLDSLGEYSEGQGFVLPTVGSVVIANTTTIPGPTKTSPFAPTPSSVLQQLAEQARQDLAVQQNIDLVSIELVRIVTAKWPYDSLGCRLPDAGYIEKRTPGYQILLKANDQMYTYHTDGKTWIGLCNVKPPNEIRTLP